LDLNTVEVFGTILGFVAVILMIKEHIWCWPVGIANAILYSIMFYHSKLYSDTILHLVYIALFIYGWYEWLYGSADKTEIKIHKTKRNEYIISAILSILGIGSFGYYFSNYTDADFAYLDATTTVLSFIAQWMLAKKLLENWILWFLIDLLASVIYLYKGLYFTSGLFFSYLILAVIGYLKWKKEYKELISA
jgi:nicotinamide mononucleotide transporter